LCIKLLRNIVVFQYAEFFNIRPLKKLARELFQNELKPLLSRVSKFPKLLPKDNDLQVIAKFNEMSRGLAKALDRDISLDDVI